MKSRMRRESHVRFCESLGVRFPRATRLFSFVIQNLTQHVYRTSWYFGNHSQLNMYQQQLIVANALYMK